MFITRLFRPFLALEGDELSGGAALDEAPAADQPVTPDATPEPGTTGAEGSTPTEPEAPETPEAPEAEQFTDLDVTGLPEEVQARHREMQADYTRKTQALAERHAELDNAVSFVTDLVADEPNETMEAVFRTLADKLGYDLEGDDHEPADEGEPDGEAEPEFRDPRLDPILAEREQKAEADRQAAYEAHLDGVETEINDGITALAKADGIDLDPAELDVIFNDVLGLPSDAGGPAVKAAYDRYKAATKAHTDRWVQSKRSPQPPNGGSAGEEPVDFNNEEERLAYTARAVEAAQRAESGH